MNVSAPFIKRPIATSLLAAAVLISGIVAYLLLPVAPLPRVDFPTISVSAGLPGASPETMAASVATPLERRFGRISGVNEITSTSSLGSTSITLQFDLDRDVDAAARDVQAAINAAGGDLPPNLPTRPNFRKVNPADSPIMILSLTSQTIPLAQMFDTANTVLAQKIAQVDGVGQVFVGGGQQPAVRVDVDPYALAGANLGLEEVRAAIAAANVNQPIGNVAGGNQSYSIATNDQLFGADAYRKIIIAGGTTAKNGALLPPVKLGDIAHVFDDVENNRVAAWSDNVRAVLLIIRRQPGANIIDVIERVKKMIPSLSTSISPAIQIQVALDRSQTIRASVHDVELTLILSVVLVVLVVFAFLRNAWATAIPSVAVPLSLIGTFGVMYLLGYSLDNLSLMALTISTGFVVDDAIVVTENITRFLEEGDTPIEAALKGAKQIGFTIVSITVSLLAVFIPILLMGGIIGRLFREFAVTLSIAIFVSAVVSLTLTPVMCSLLLRHETKHGRLYNASERFFVATVNGYGRALDWVLDHRILMGLVTVGTVALTVFLFVKIPKGLFPQQDTGALMGFSEAGQDTSFPAMKARQQAVNQVLAKEKDIKHFVSFTGGGFGSNAGNTGTVFVELVEKPPRKQSADDLLNSLRPKLGGIPGIKLFLQSVQDVRIGGRGARTQYQYTLEDANLDELVKWAPKVMERLKSVQQVKDVASDQQVSGLSLHIDVDRDTAGRLGLSAAQVDNTLYDAFGQAQISVSYTQLNQYRVILDVAPEYQQNPDALGGIFVRSNTGQMVPLRSFASFRNDTTALSINHQGQFPAITLSFNLAPGASLGQAVDEIHKAEVEIGLPPGIHAEFQGTAQAFQASLASEPMLILMALITVYIVLGVLYESLVHPITILSTIPSAGVGALVALMIMHTDFSIIALIGIILLIGIVKKNAIMMIDFAIEVEREEGLSPRDAIHKACVLRFRPIMMTTLAALLGGVPLAIGTGTGSELRQPLGIAIVGGLMFSQMLTLFTTPVVYLALDRFSSKSKERRERLSHVPPAPAPAE